MLRSIDFKTMPFKRVHRHHLGSDSDTLRTHAIRRVRMHLRP